MEAQARPIGVFDSGLGGISVLRACVRLLPQENFLFFGDSANAPYGEKSLDQVRALTLSAVDRVAGARGQRNRGGLATPPPAQPSACCASSTRDCPSSGIEPAVSPPRWLRAVLR